MNSERAPIPVAVLGASGLVGREVVSRLQGHPWFTLIEVAASPGSAGRPLPGTDLTLLAPEGPFAAPLVLSALPSAIAREIEPALAQAGHLVVSNASAHRMRSDVPLIIPEVNSGHLALLETQPWSGGIVTNPNCSVAGLALALAPLHRHFGVERVIVTTMQAISGAGREGAGDIENNVIPLIPGEEEKVATEPQKILGTMGDDGIDPAVFSISATCTRVPVQDGHLLSVSVKLSEAASVEQAGEALATFRSEEAMRLPSAPEHPIEVLEGAHPQPRLDRDRGAGMTVSVGRLRACEILDLKFCVLAHNLVRGAAGAALLNAELAAARGVVPSMVGTP